MPKRTHDDFEDDHRCKYAGKPCLNERAFKSTGERHNLCVTHRDTALASQKKYRETKRQKLAGFTEQASATAGSPPCGDATSLVRRSRRAISETTALAISALQLAPSDDLRCNYGENRCCKYIRAIKNTGELHTKCEIHRKGANRHQRNHVAKKKMMKMEHQGEPTTTAEALVGGATSQVDSAPPLDAASAVFVPAETSSGQGDAPFRVTEIANSAAVGLPLMSLPDASPSTSPVEPLWNDDITNNLLQESAAFLEEVNFAVFDVEDDEAFDLLQARGSGPAPTMFEGSSTWGHDDHSNIDKPSESISIQKMSVLVDDLSRDEATEVGAAANPFVPDLFQYVYDDPQHAGSEDLDL